VEMEDREGLPRSREKLAYSVLGQSEAAKNNEQ
jgi:hypothetical protein